ncbi:MAG: hypothetical protein WAN50_04815 [Minisyncoccia bacterium]
MKKWIRYIFFGLVGLFALIGLVFTAVFVGMRFGLFNVRGSIAERNQFFAQTSSAATSTPPCVDTAVSVCAWNATPEWTVIKGGLEKDAPVIARVSAETGVPERILAATVVPEQTRFFTSERDIFKSYFEPLKILGSLSQFSLGVTGIKQETANQIEMFAASTTSPFYPGASAATLIAYPAGTVHDTELFNRLTDAKNHYYSYLYTALYIKEIESQWKAAGYDIGNKPGVIVTLFNIGFQNSKPNASPNIGGSSVESGGNTYTYGELGQDFYDSNELTDIFPK